MKSSGIIVEYNPFHNGHALHINKTKEKTGTECLIAVMSGNFVQRGEPAIISKWHRTEMALKAGVDLVIELPFVFATQSADYFANSAVGILNSLGVDSLVFGSEAGSISSFMETAKEIISTPKTIVDENTTGYSYARKYGQLHQNNSLDDTLPNNILGIQYVRALLDLNSNIQPETILREKAGYHQKDISDQSIASATSIRAALFEDEDDISPYIPQETLHVINQFTAQGGALVSWDELYPHLQSRIITSSPEELANNLLVSEGIENRIKKIVPSERNFTECMEAIKTKRYTWTRIQRTLLHMALNTKKEICKLDTGITPPYIRVLGFSDIGRQYLQIAKKETEVPIITLPKQISHPYMDAEIQAGQLYAQLQPSFIVKKRLMQREFEGPVKMKRT